MKSTGRGRVPSSPPPSPRPTCSGCQGRRRGWPRRAPSRPAPQPIAAGLACHPVPGHRPRSTGLGVRARRVAAADLGQCLNLLKASTTLQLEATARKLPSRPTQAGVLRSCGGTSRGGAWNFTAILIRGYHLAAALVHCSRLPKLHSAWRCPELSIRWWLPGRWRCRQRIFPL